MPNSLRIRIATRTSKAKDIVRKAQKALLNERVTENNRNLKFCREQVTALCVYLQARLSHNQFTRVSAHCACVEEAEYIKTKHRDFFPDDLKI